MNGKEADKLTKGSQGEHEYHLQPGRMKKREILTVVHKRRVGG